MEKLRWFYLSIIFFSVFLVSSSSPYEREEMKHSGFNDSFSALLSGSFQNYVKQATMIVKKSRVDLGDHNADFIVEANIPFILYPPKWCQRNDDKTYEKGVILIHDLGASPYQMRELSYYFASKCYLVYVPLLSGHGTRPGDLLNVDYKDWIQQVKHAVKDMKVHTKKIFLGGHGMGGTLVLHYALNNIDPFVSGLILSATPTTISKISQMFLSVISVFKNWGSLYLNRDKVRYETIAINGSRQQNYLLEDVEGVLRKNRDLLKHLPVFGVYTSEDENLDFPESLNLLLRQTAVLNRKLIIYTADVNKYQMISDKEVNVDIVSSRNEPYRVYSLSHIALLHRPDDIWYGQNGNYRDCYRYSSDSEDHRKCLQDSQVWYAETGYFDDSKYILARTTFNPYLINILHELTKFLNR